MHNSIKTWMRRNQVHRMKSWYFWGSLSPIWFRDQQWCGQLQDHFKSLLKWLTKWLLLSQCWFYYNVQRFFFNGKSASIYYFANLLWIFFSILRLPQHISSWQSHKVCKNTETQTIINSEYLGGCQRQIQEKTFTYPCNLA